MIYYLKECILFLILSFHVTANWRLIDYSFTDANNGDNNWKMFGSCPGTSLVSFNRKSCIQNPQTYAQLINSIQFMKKSFRYKSFSVQVVFDVFFIEAVNTISQFEVSYSNSVETILIYRRNYKRSDLIQDSQAICDTSFSKFEFFTITNTITPLNNQDKFLINVCFNPGFSYMEIGIRNMLIYVNPCHPTCLSCNGPLEINCLTCFDGQSLSGGQCQCISEQQFSETFIGCRQECDRDYSIARYDKICVQDYRIKSYSEFFNSNPIPVSNVNRYSPFIFITDIFHPKITDLIYQDCYGYDLIGQLQFSEGMLYQMNLEDSVKFLRIRLTFYLFNLQDSSKIEILNDNQIQSRIIKTTTDFQYENLNKIFQRSCGSSSTLLRIEMTFQVFNSHPTIKIQGQLQQASEFWGFRNVTIDTGLCQQNCKICQDYSKCALCEAGSQLYRNQCVQTCPIHSVNCVDYEDITPYSRYIAKGFYDLNMTLDEIQSFYDTSPDPYNNLATTQTFSFLNNKIVLGGLLVWNDGSYTKTWTISQPHYGVSIYFTLTYGDGYTGLFSYKVDTTNGLFINPGGGSNIIGQVGSETTSSFQVSLTNFYNTNLDVEFKCRALIPNINNGFCAISNYFIVVHYCPPFCLSCSSSSGCTAWQAGYTSSNCLSNQYLNFDQQTETYSCNYCDQVCRTCSSGEECQQCISDEFQLINGICLCKPFSFRSGVLCSQCNRYCENCFGSTQYNCISCIEEFHRSIQQNQCLCQPGYYDDGINLPCLPKCGDKMVVEEEDCDDGNNDPFDGCDQCQFKCQEECKLCYFGKCYQCKDNYQLVEAINKCLPICGDLVIVKNEQCDDGNNYAFDGCHHCQLQCYDHCLKCNQGICEKCDEINGWYLTGVHCEFVCGDGIIAQGQELCDDSNLNPFDLCNNCEQGCSQYCMHCQNGNCLKCDIGFQYDQYTRQCIQICGDNLIVENEQCEDQMISYITQCENCQFKCNPNCILCQFGKCQQCQIGYLLVNNECEEICGDGQIIGTEVCDTLIQDINSHCYNCNYNCLSGCLLCNQGICQICKEGYFLDYFQCRPFCGDLLIVELELCDDGNLIPYDGCLNCNFSCEMTCDLCEFGNCINTGDVVDDPNSSTFDCSPDCKICEQQDICSSCWEHFQLINKQCVPICGDGIIIEGLEECDDGNDLPDDGCYQCQFQCSNGCVDCQQSQCQKCDDVQYTLDIQTAKCVEKIQDQTEINVDLQILEEQHYTVLRCGENQLLVDNVCVNLCGNGILINQYEECDDGNTFGGDGCSSFCNIESSYKCVNQEGSLSSCTFIRSPEFILNILSDKMNSTQILELTFTQEVKLQTELKFDELVFFTITTQTQYLINISYIQNISIHLSSPKYRISIEFLEPIIDPILQVDIERSIIQNQFEQDLQDYQKSILLGTPFVLPEATKKQLTSIVQINDVMMYSMVSVSSLALLTGNAIMFFNLLDLLQSLSYIKFMQYQFPPHLKEFLDTYTKVSLQPIMNYFQVDQLLAKLNGGTLPYQVSNKSQQKSTANALNQFYLINAKSCYFSVLASILTYLIYCMIVSESVQNFIFKFYNQENPNSKILKLIDFFQEKIQKKCLKLKFEYFSLGIFKLYQAILHQLIFSTLLQFPNYQFNRAFEIFNSINAIVGLLFVFCVTFNLFSITSAEIKDLRKWKYFYFESKTSFWQVQCKSFQIYRVLFYIMIIVQLMNYPEAQSILLSMLSFFYLIYLIKFKPLQSQFELHKLICRELVVMLITGTFLIYSFDFSQDSYMLFGWIHIGMFCSILASNLFIDIYVQIQKIYDSYQQKKIKDKNEQERKYYYNHLQSFIVNDQDYHLQNKRNR